MQVENKYIRFDWAVKRMLRDKANFAVLEGLVTVLLGEKIVITELLESEGSSEDSSIGEYRITFLAKNVSNEPVVCEIRVTREFYYRWRIVKGLNKLFARKKCFANNYDQVKKVYSINIIYFDLGKGSDYLYHGKTVFTGVHTGDNLVVNTKEADEIRMTAPENVFPEYYIIRVNEFNKVATTPIEEWLDYLKNNRINDDTSTPGLQEARKKLLYMTMSDAERHAYDAHMEDLMVQNDVLDTAKLEGLEQGRAEGRAEGEVIGLEKGRAEGEQTKALNIARNLKSMGLGVADIQKATGLSEEEIREL